MKTQRDPHLQRPLLTAEEAAFQLLTEATLQAWRSGGVEGLVPVKSGSETMYRPQDVAGFIEHCMRSAA